MKVLFLRGQVPTDRDPSQIMFDELESVDDMWTQLAYSLSKDDYGEIWYWGGKRNKTYKYNFVERWIPDFNNSKWDFDPDVIFARGGFPEYDVVLKRFPNAYKIYYGAGKRSYPESGFKNYDLILNDTPSQLKKTQKLFKNTKVSLWTKPAAENIFYPLIAKKKYDVIMVGNENKKRDIKGHGFAINNVTEDMRFLKVGITLKETKKKNPHIEFTDWIEREKIPYLYAQSKVAIVCCETIDSCPRVIPEALACDCPILVLDRVNFWQSKYITPESGRICTKETFAKELIDMINNFDQFYAYDYYKKYLSLDQCVKHLIRQVN